MEPLGGVGLGKVDRAVGRNTGLEQRFDGAQRAYHTSEGEGLMWKVWGRGWVRRVDRGCIMDGTKEQIEGIRMCLEAWEHPRDLEKGERLLGNIRGYQLISLAWARVEPGGKREDRNERHEEGVCRISDRSDMSREKQRRGDREENLKVSDRGV